MPSRKTPTCTKCGTSKHVVRLFGLAAKQSGARYACTHGAITLDTNRAARRRRH